MIKKAAEPKSHDRVIGISTSSETSEHIHNKPVAPTESWNVHWNIHRRLLEARRKLRGTKLWQQFELQRSFDAFSIHTLARGVEEVLNDLGVVSHFATTKWQKAGNTTVIEGVVVFTNVDDGTTLEIPSVGEGVDPDDKGMGKADSYARKLGLVNALNLGIGVDNEASQQAANPAPAAGPTMAGTPRQSAKGAADYVHPASGATNGAGNKLYTLQQTGAAARGVLGRDMLNNCWIVINNSPTASALDAFCEMNKDQFDQFFLDDPATGTKLNQLISSQRETLMAKGRV